MNPLTIEQALKSALASSFAGATIYTGTDYEELTPESLNFIVSVSDLKHTVGGLYRASVDFKIAAPALLGATAYDQMTTALATLSSCLTSTFLGDHWPTATGTPAFAGIWVEETKTAREQHCWTADVSTVIGIQI